MTELQRSSPVNLMHSILACSCCTPDIRARAELLLMKLQPERNPFADIFRGFRNA